MTKPVAELVAGIDLAPIRNLVKKYRETEAALAKAESTEERLSKEIKKGMAEVNPTDQEAFKKAQDQLGDKRDQLALLPAFRSRCEHELEQLDEQIHQKIDTVKDCIGKLTVKECAAFVTHVTPIVAPFMNKPDRARLLIGQMDAYTEIAHAAYRLSFYPPWVGVAESGFIIIDRFLKTGSLCLKPWKSVAAKTAPASK